MSEQETGNEGQQGTRRSIANNNIWTGVFILIIGVAALIRINNPGFPEWIFSWQTLLIALGIFLGFKHNFRGPAWFILILVGGIFLFGELNPDISARRYVIPAILISIGMFLIFRPGHGQRCGRRFQQKKNSDNPLTPDQMSAGTDTQEDFVDSTSIFGGAKKNIISKNFRGGDLVNIFGGTELDLTRADFNGTAEIDMTTIFGGTKLIIPPNWTVKSDAVTIFGGLEDKRNMHLAVDDPSKVLVLKGTVIFGGIELKSY